MLEIFTGFGFLFVGLALLWLFKVLISSLYEEVWESWLGKVIAVLVIGLTVWGTVELLRYFFAPE